MADIGTDHGFLPLYLWEQGISPKVIMADVSPGSLEKARQCCRFNHPDEEFDLRLGSGLEVLSEGEVDDIVIAGMGGILMTEILDADRKKALSFRKFVFQPRRHPGRLRHYLFRSGFRVINEKLVREGKYICEIITAVPGDASKEVTEMADVPENSILWEVPAAFGERKDPLTLEYLGRKIEKEEKKLEKLKLAGDTRKKELEIRKSETNMNYLSSLLGNNVV